jgi:hypothetical protein
VVGFSSNFSQVLPSLGNAKGDQINMIANELVDRVELSQAGLENLPQNFLSVCDFINE